MVRAAETEGPRALGNADLLVRAHSPGGEAGLEGTEAQDTAGSGSGHAEGGSPEPRRCPPGLRGRGSAPRALRGGGDVRAFLGEREGHAGLLHAARSRRVSTPGPRKEASILLRSGHSTCWNPHGLSHPSSPFPPPTRWGSHPERDGLSPLGMTRFVHFTHSFSWGGRNETRPLVRG